jgi:hypothetical protein
MSKKKHIDQLFKEHFIDFEVTPSPHVWKNIQAKLKKEDEDRKVIPLWFKLGGVAAVLALLFIAGNLIFNPSSKIDQEITDQDMDPIEHKIKKDIPIEETFVDSNEITNEDASDTKHQVKKSKSDNLNKVIKEQTSISKDKNDIAVETEKDINKKNIKEGIAKNTTNKEDRSNDDPTTETESLIKKEIPVSEVEETKVVTTPVNEAENVEDEGEDKKRSIFDAIDEENEKEAVVTVSNDPDHRWEVAPNFAPVYYNSLGEGSSIDPTFSDNAKTGDVNFSYGVQVAYNFTDRLSLRSGISKVDLSYSTQGIELGTGPVSVALKSVDYGDKGIVLTALDKGTLASQDNNGEFGQIIPKSTSEDAVINQELNYFEVPMELRYTLINNKFGVNLIGGFSTLFLGNNEISVSAGEFESVLGEANNLSSVSFTTNVGVGLKYSFSEKLMFNIEPIFKYQLNPYTDSSVDFRPYYFGVYTGLSLKF